MMKILAEAAAVHNTAARSILFKTRISSSRHLPV
jgi:hypothetical protein